MRIIVGRHKILFLGDIHTTSYDKHKKTWNCSCIHGCIGHNHDEHPCKHVKEYKKGISKLLS